MKSAAYYAVKVGRRVGIYVQWEEAKAQVEKFPGAMHKKFKSLEEAKQYLGNDSIAVSDAGKEHTSGNNKAEAAPSRGPRVPLSAPSAAPLTPSVAPSSFMNAFWPCGFSGLNYPSLNIEIYTDGSCLGNNNVAAKKCPAGWGFLAVPLSRLSSSSEPTRVLFEMFGPVVLDARSPYFIGATVGSNNTGELSAMVEALLWLQALEDEYGAATTVEAAGKVIIRGDSTYAMKSISGEFNGAKNKELIHMARNALRRLQETRTRRGAPAVQFQHVKGHSDDVFNDRADVLANLGSAGQQCNTGRYWVNGAEDTCRNSNSDAGENNSKRPRV